MSVHVYPISEEHEHTLDGDGGAIGVCVCDPTVEWIDDVDGLPYEDGPLVIHNRLRALPGDET